MIVKPLSNYKLKNHYFSGRNKTVENKESIPTKEDSIATQLLIENAMTTSNADAVAWRNTHRPMDRRASSTLALVGKQLHPYHPLPPYFLAIC